jgi:solute carrier family 25 carnitine/acylcarnitine transporter 20/29
MTDYKTAKNLFAGAVGGMTSVLVCHPMDTVRTRLQTGTQFRGAMHCFSSTVKQEGVGALYKGIAGPFLAQGVYKGVIFSANTTIGSLIKTPGKELSLWQKALCGSIAGAINSFVVTPVELVRNRLQVQYSADGKPQYKGSLDCMQQIVKERGITGM